MPWTVGGQGLLSSSKINVSWEVEQLKKPFNGALVHIANYSSHDMPINYQQFH